VLLHDKVRFHFMEWRALVCCWLAHGWKELCRFRFMPLLELDSISIMGCSDLTCVVCTLFADGPCYSFPA
jgi:hypothetical protein